MRKNKLVGLILAGVLSFGNFVGSYLDWDVIEGRMYTEEKAS